VSVSCQSFTAINNLAVTLRIQGKWNEAATMQKEVLERRGKLLGEEHTDTITMSSLAVTLYVQGKLDDGDLLKAIHVSIKYSIGSLSSLHNPGQFHSKLSEPSLSSIRILMLNVHASVLPTQPDSSLVSRKM
jgi:hypothetical protein